MGRSWPASCSRLPACLALAGICRSTLPIAWQLPTEARLPLLPATSAGALAGALHGCEWIPSSWYNDLENGAGGRDEVVEVARQLALLDCSDVFPLQPSNEQLQVLVQQLHDRLDAEAPVAEEQLKQGLAQLRAQQEAAAAGGGKH